MSQPIIFDNYPALTLYQQIYLVIRQIPAGKVTTYGQIASVVGGKCRPRTVGYALSAAPPEGDVPWHRVVNRQGRISLRGGGVGSSRQQVLLEAEGIKFDPTGRIDFEQYGWLGPEWSWLEQNSFHPLPILTN